MKSMQIKLLYVEFAKKQTSLNKNRIKDTASLFPNTKYFPEALIQRSPTFLTPGTGFMEDSFSMDSSGGWGWGRLGVGGGWGGITALAPPHNIRRWILMGSRQLDTSHVQFAVRFVLL